MKLKTIFTASLILSLLSAGKVWSQNGASSSSVAIKPGISKGETVYEISEKDCRIQFIQQSKDSKTLRHFSECKLPIREQANLIEKILAKISENQSLASQFDLLTWGNLDQSPELSKKLALAAKKSTLWDAKLGKPKSGDDNSFILALDKETKFYKELSSAFQRQNRKLSIQNIETLIVESAEKLPYFAELKKQGVKASDKLPVDALIWFSVPLISQ